MRGSICAGRYHALVVVCALPMLAVSSAPAQVFTVEAEHVEKHYTQFPPTDVRLSTEPMTTLTRQQLIRFLQAEHGFAMRPLPIGNLTLVANGGMEPSGEKYVQALHSKGIAAKPGDRVVITDIKIQNDKIVLDLNNGPYHKHRFLRHISVGTDPYYTNPVVQDDGAQPTGSRLTLVFPKRIPDITGEQVEALLKPMIDFGVKSPAAAYAETLPEFLRKAIEEHRVLVGMNRDMVVYAKGQPERKVREQENGHPFEIWIYGETPQPVEFVRFIGTHVARIELAKVGEPVQVRTANEMGDYWGNQPVMAVNEHQIKLGDRSAQDTAAENAPKAPPSLRNPGEKLPSDKDKNSQPVVAPVNFPKDQQRPGDPGYTPPQPGGSSQQPSVQPSGSDPGQQQTSTTGGTAQPAPQ